MAPNTLPSVLTEPMPASMPPVNANVKQHMIAQKMIELSTETYNTTYEFLLIWCCVASPILARIHLSSGADSSE